jgi:hypothetical protein|nr:MAG TPA: hypothetical protein [Caudoviricetes sp.]
MKTIYNEKQYAERSLIKKQIDKKNGLTLAILCKYYFFEKNKNKKQILKLLSKFIDEAGGIYDKELLPELVEKYTLENTKLPDVGSIRITLDEIAVILSRDNVSQQKLLFAMLVTYKFKNERCKMIEELKQYADNCVINNPLSEYFKDTKVKYSRDNKRLIGEAYRDGLISLDDNNKKFDMIKLNFVNEDSPTAFEVKWQNDIWVDLEIYKGNKQYRRCECCGDAIKLKKSKVNGDVSKYCSDGCKKYMNKLRVAKYRDKNVINADA